MLDILITEYKKSAGGSVILYAVLDDLTSKLVLRAMMRVSAGSTEKSM